MSRPLRVEYRGAIYHVMCRGNARQRIFHDDADHQRLVDGLALTVSRFGWELFSFVLMPNHFHLFFRTPQPSLSRGMQYLASGYANWFAKRQRGLTTQPENPFRDATQGWLLGSPSFVDKIRDKVGQRGHHDDEVPAARRLSAVDPVMVQAAVAAHYGVDPRTFQNRRSESISRDVAAWLCRQLTSCTLRELAAVFGLGHPDSVRNLTRRVDCALSDSGKLRQDITAIRRELLETEEF
jgi:REP element-mobilizing transposase RayT